MHGELCSGLGWQLLAPLNGTIKKLRTLPRVRELSVSDYQVHVVKTTLSITPVYLVAVLLVPLALVVSSCLVSFGCRSSSDERYCRLDPRSSMFHWEWVICGMLGWITRLDGWSDKGLNGKRSPTPVGVIRVLRERHATDLKDKSFGLNGVLDRTMRKSLPTPDYTNSLGRVYHILLSEFLTWRPSSINSLLDAGSSLPGTPSWVPDWSTINDRTWLYSNYIYDYTDSESEIRGEPQVDLTDGVLRVKAVIKGEVMYSSNSIRSSGTNAHEGYMNQQVLITIVLARWLRSIVQGFLPVTGHCQSVPEGVLNALLAISDKQEQSHWTEHHSSQQASSPEQGTTASTR